MPLELGLFLGAKGFGSGRHRQKRCIILDRERYRYQKFISDIAGQDIHSYGGTAPGLIAGTVSRLRHEAGNSKMPGGKAVAQEFEQFQRDVPKICAEMKLDPGELTFQDLRKLAERWIMEGAAAASCSSTSSQICP
jgi:hypothetical protein